ncbi:MAG: exodeoxyribonuclease III [Gammaproteobacteria bacterium]|nr:exodeoxyribonuclease III [Gammaproteobacteria bacterium]MXY04239.1 exodeoxyribonuclease III [Gammaproteobacteria bacterium]MYE53420.1 exodeoxyribonuclease III [Gammaproteobacteria bacterium]MYE86483.1 exodeoxyribonuclease III [Gammaproteobacteria bacterium]MYF12430.1 exodeoxyribonuclease III [Gammaproteobacteria bacterium]
MRFVTFNANGIRARLHQIEAIDQAHRPDVIAVQETKVDDTQFPVEAVQAIGYEHLVIHGQKGHYGVALFSRIPPTDAQCGFPWREADQQRRFVSASYDVGGRRVQVINGYFPQGESRDHPVKFPAKAQYYSDLTRYLNERCDPRAPLIVAGDMNVAPEDTDIGIGEDNRKRWLRTGKTSFLPEEREWLATLMDWGLTDAYRRHVGDGEQGGGEPRYSWFDYRSRGFERDPKRGLRIDLVLTTEALTDAVADCGIDYRIRGSQKPSDHCPVWCHFTPAD